MANLSALNETQLKLLQRYDGQFRKLEDKANALKHEWQKIANEAKKQIDTTNRLVNEKIEWADREVRNLISNAHASTVFKVEGEENIFYPIVIYTGYQPFKFFISRDSVHWDKTWYGRCIIQIEGFTSHWGHGANWTRVITNYHSRTRFLARGYELMELGWIVLYLRGDTTYRFISDWKSAKLLNYSTKNKRWQRDNSRGGDAGWVEFRPVQDGKETTYQEKFKSNWVYDLTKGGVKMISRATNGRIVDTTQNV